MKGVLQGLCGGCGGFAELCVVVLGLCRACEWLCAKAMLFRYIIAVWSIRVVTARKIQGSGHRPNKNP